MGNKAAETESANNDVLREVRALRPKIEARAPEIEAERQLPMDLVEALRGCGVFRMYVPKTHGGLELDFLDSLEVIIELAAADGSVGWTAMIGCATPWMFAGLQRKNIRYDLRIDAGRHSCGFHRSCWDCGASARRISCYWTVALCERMPACGLDARRMRHHRKWDSGTGTS